MSVFSDALTNKTIIKAGEASVHEVKIKQNFSKFKNMYLLVYFSKFCFITYLFLYIFLTSISDFLDYVEDILQTLVKATKEELKKAAADLKKKSPAPMNTMLEKQSKDEAMKKKDDRSKMVTEDVPPTTPGSFFSV